ncbi:MAG: imidazoleglycerol-phosphate dehydratase HisB [Oscillospiraceae bacterium]
MRTAEMSRITKETNIKIKVNLDGTGKNIIDTGIGFFDHMLTAFSLHSRIDMEIKVSGDLNVDAHHTVEDTGIVLGKAISMAIAEKDNITRYGSASIPMDEALAEVVLDVCARPYLVFNAEFNDDKIGEFDTCLTEEFFRALAFNAGITMHINLSYGKNDHHKCEAIFKATAHALKKAIATNDNTILSTKGII